jgi:c-di-GMP-binding flagellar brake protein YcgR
VTRLLESGYKRSEGQSKDLSAAGIGVLLAEEIPMGAVLSLNFRLPTLNASWEVRAVVRHRRGYHYGLEFLSLTPAQRELLANYLTDLERVD